jgi:WD40 repeat protein
VKSYVAPLLLFAAVLATSCSGDESAWTPGNIEIGDARVVDLETSIFEISVSPLGDRYATTTDGEVCVQALERGGDDECAGLDDGRSAASTTFAWNSDGSQILFTDDSRFDFEEPDVTVFDIESGDVAVLTDDGESSYGESTSIDVAPFFGPDDAVYFFRAGGIDERFDLMRLDDSGDVKAVGDIGLPRGSFIAFAPRPIGGDRWLLLVDEVDPGTSTLAVVDLGDESIETIELDEQSFLVDATATQALIISARARAQLFPEPFSLVSLGDGRDRSVKPDLDGEESVTGVGFSPDGAAVVAAISSFEESNNDRIVTMELDDDRLGETVELFDADQFDGKFDDTVPPFNGLGATGEIAWTESGRLVVGLGRENFAVVETTKR